MYRLLKFLQKNPIIIAYFLLILATMLFLIGRIPNTGYDTPSYVNFSVTRPPIYPLFIWIFRWAGQYQFQAIMWTQSILTLSALAYAQYWLRENTNIPDSMIFCIMLVTLVTICFHSQMWYIQSEGLTFPIFIFTFFVLIACFREFDFRRIFWLSGLVAMLVLLRQQFYYLCGMFILLPAWYWYQKISLKKITVCFFIFFGSMVMMAMVDESYHHIKHHYFKERQLLYLLSQVSVQAIYLSQEKVIHFFPNDMEKNTMQNILQQLKKQNLNQDAASLNNKMILQYLEYAYEEYSRNYVAIQGIISDELYRNRTLSEANQLLNNITKTLVQNNFQENFLFYGWKVIAFMGGVPGFLFFCLLLYCVGLAVCQRKGWVFSNEFIFVMLSVIITFCNVLVVALTETALPPYFCYTQFLLYCLAGIFASFLTKRIKS